MANGKWIDKFFGGGLPPSQQHFTNATDKKPVQQEANNHHSNAGWHPSAPKPPNYK